MSISAANKNVSTGINAKCPLPICPFPRSSCLLPSLYPTLIPRVSAPLWAPLWWPLCSASLLSYASGWQKWLMLLAATSLGRDCFPHMLLRGCSESWEWMSRQGVNKQAVSKEQWAPFPSPAAPLPLADPQLCPYEPLAASVLPSTLQASQAAGKPGSFPRQQCCLQAPRPSENARTGLIPMVHPIRNPE